MRESMRRIGLFSALTTALLGSAGCGRPPTLSITAETLPPQARSLALSVTRSVPGVGEQATAEPLTTYDLPQPTPSRQSLLLRLPAGFSGTLNISLAAFSGVAGAGCLQRVGFASHDFAPQPYDDELVLPLDTDPGDHDCELAAATLPRLIAAEPGVVGTAGGEPVRLRGWGFVPGSEVYVDDSKLAEVRLESGSALSTVTSARDKPGAVRLRVVLPGGGAAEDGTLLRYRFSTPSFAAQPVVSSPYLLRSIDCSDINGDGIFDLLLSPISGNRLTSILVATQEPTSYSIGGVGAPGPVTPAIFSDLDRDGRPDIVTGYLPTKEVWTRRNSGSGAIYEGSLIYALADEPTFVHAGDLNGDGYPDVVGLSETGRSLGVLLNDRTGRLGAAKTTTLAASTSPFALTSADVNLDGQRDLILIDHGQSQTRTLLNSPASPGRFASTDTVSLLTALSGPASSLFGIDIDGDRHEDTLVAIESKGELLISYSRPTLAVLSPPIKVCAAPHLAIAADLDKDGVVELIVACNSEGQVQVLQRRSDGSYGELLRIAVPTSLGPLLGLTAVEYDGDGRTDIALAGSQGMGFLRNESR